MLQRERLQSGQLRQGCAIAILIALVLVAAVAALLLIQGRIVVPFISVQIPGSEQSNQAERIGPSPPQLGPCPSLPSLPFTSPEPKDWRPCPSEVRFKLDPGASYPISIVDVPSNARIYAVVQVAFNTNLTIGVPDVNLVVQGPKGDVVPLTRVKSGYQLSFTTSESGRYTLIVSNEHSRLYAKQVAVTFH